MVSGELSVVSFRSTAHLLWTGWMTSRVSVNLVKAGNVIKKPSREVKVV